jgi:hypothetical protein
MTIGIGFLDAEEILLGSDMEMTGGGTLKYRGSKDHWGWFDGEDGTIAAVYAGLENDMRAVWEKLEEGIYARQSDTSVIGVKGVREVLEHAVDEVIGKKKSSFEMLVGISKKQELPLFLKVFGNRVVRADRWELIGYGNCELAHYLLQMFDERGPNTLPQAVLWATHIISTANHFVQYVGQGIRLLVVANGQLHLMDGDMFTQRLAEIERRIAGIWFDACNTKLSPEELKAALDRGITGIISASGSFSSLMRYALKPQEQ